MKAKIEEKRDFGEREREKPEERVAFEFGGTDEIEVFEGNIEAKVETCRQNPTKIRFLKANAGEKLIVGGAN